MAPEFREYLRASTTVINAVIRPVVERYLERIESRLADAGVQAKLLVMQSSGGVFSFEAARGRPVFMVESGPAAGVIASAHLGETLERPDILSFDMGGTTAKVGLIQDGQPSVTKDYNVGGHAGAGIGGMSLSGYPVRTPVVDLVEIGAGGGSIAWVDSGGLLRVGPQSAGADPGPVCYRRGGTEPTVTDANVVLGRLNPNYFLGGEIGLDVEGARRAIEERCAKPLGLDVVEAANGIVEIANAAMVNALHLISVQRGYDPRDFVLVGFGGAGPVHANALARDAEMPTLLIPPSPGIFSATGLLTTDLKLDTAVTMMRRLDDLNAADVDASFTELEAAGRSALELEGLTAETISFVRKLDLRYIGQSYELTIPAGDGLRERFHQEHDRTYGFSAPEEPVEVVSLRLTSVGAIRKPPARPLAHGGPAEPKETRPVYFAEASGFVDCPIYDRYALPAGATFAGPAIVEEFDSTTVVHPGFDVRVDDLGNLVIEREARRCIDRHRSPQPSRAGEERVRRSYGIVVSKDVMVEMRDGIRLATDLYRPARDGELVPGRYPTIVCMTPYDKTERRYVEIADFFVPHGYAVVLQDLRDRHRSEGSNTYFHSATPHTGEDGYDTIEWIAAQPWSNGRTGTVGSSYAGITQIRTALESPPHLTAIWPDVAPTNTFQNQTREGGAMQLHMFWALYIHAADHQGVKEDWEKQREVFGDLQRLRELLWNSPRAARRPRAPPRAGARPDARGLLHARCLRRVLGREGERLHALLARARRHPGDDDDRLVRPLPPRRQRVLRGDDGEERVAAAADHRAVEPRRHAGRRDVDARRRLRADVRLGCAALLRRAARVLRPLAPRRRKRTAGGRGAREDLRDGRRQRPQDRARQARPRRPLARRAGVAARTRDRADAPPPPRRLAPR